MRKLADKPLHLGAIAFVLAKVDCPGRHQCLPGGANFGEGPHREQHRVDIAGRLIHPLAEDRPGDTVDAVRWQARQGVINQLFNRRKPCLNKIEDDAILIEDGDRIMTGELLNGR